MGTCLDAQIEIYFPANEYYHGAWQVISKWEFNKNYELSMVLEDFKHHLGDDWTNHQERCLKELEIRKTIDMSEDDLDCICRVQLFSHEELLLISSEYNDSFFSSLIHSLGPLIHEYTTERVRIIFWRDQ